MFNFGSQSAAAPQFVPEAESQEWLLARFIASIRALMPHSDAGGSRFDMPKSPSDLDHLFDLVCAVQSRIGQKDIEITLLPMQDDTGPIPNDYKSLHSADGQLMQTLFGRDEYVICFSPAIFKKSEILIASVARELGRIANHQVLAKAGPGGQSAEQLEVLDHTHAELSANALGLGVWITSGSYIFENSCCGGGCGINLKGLRTGLSMPEAAFVLALDGLRRQQRRRSIAWQLPPNQKAAFVANWKALQGHAKPRVQALQAATSLALT